MLSKLPIVGKSLDDMVSKAYQNKGVALVGNSTKTVLIGMGTISILRFLADQTPIEADDQILDRVYEVIDMDEDLY